MSVGECGADCSGSCGTGGAEDAEAEVVAGGAVSVVVSCCSCLTEVSAAGGPPSDCGGANCAEDCVGATCLKGMPSTGRVTCVMLAVVLPGTRSRALM